MSVLQEIYSDFAASAEDERDGEERVPMNEKIPGCPLFKDDVPKGENLPLKKKATNPLKEIWDWYRHAKVKPYVTVKNLNGDEPASGMDHTAAEAGIKISF